MWRLIEKQEFGQTLARFNLGFRPYLVSDLIFKQDIF